MIAVLDANVLFPTVLREILADCAASNLFTPIWSERILQEWTRAAARLGPIASDIAAAEAALLRDRFPAAAMPGDEDRARGFDLPDPADLHVLAAGLESGAQAVVTLNLRDFPRRAMAAAGLRALHPDAFLMELWLDDPDAVAAAVTAAHAKAESLGGPVPLRSMMKRARLPRLGRALGGRG